MGAAALWGPVITLNNLLHILRGSCVIMNKRKRHLSAISSSLHDETP